MKFENNIATLNRKGDTLIPPMYYEIEFFSRSGKNFSKTIYHTAGAFNWSINADEIKDRDKKTEYRARIKTVFGSEISGGLDLVEEEPCENEPTNSYTQLFARYWACLDVTHPKQVLIEVDKVCNGKIDCKEDKSDERYSVCRPPDELFQSIVYGVIIFVLVSGMIVFSIIHCFPKILIKYPEIDFSAYEIKATKRITEICLSSSKDNERKNGGLKKRHLDFIDETYHPCKNDNQSKIFLKLTFTFALIKNYTNFCNQIFDQFIKAKAH